MKKGQTSVRNGIEDILFPMEVCNITQGDNVGTHKGTYAVDLAGKDTGRDTAYFPFSAKSVALDSYANGNAVIWESLNKVRFADGTIDYACIMVIHDNDATGYAVGSSYKQGQQMAVEGTAGIATGNHLHIEIKKGKFERGNFGMYQQNVYGVYHMKNNMPIENACFMDNTTIKAGKAEWKYLKDVPVTETPSKPQTPPAHKPDQILNKGEKFKFASQYLVENINVRDNMIYNSVIGGWISASICTEVNGNNDQILNKGERFTINGTFTVADVNVKANLILVKELGFWVKANSLIEV